MEKENKEKNSEYIVRFHTQEEECVAHHSRKCSEETEYYPVRQPLLATLIVGLTQRLSWKIVTLKVMYAG